MIRPANMSMLIIQSGRQFELNKGRQLYLTIFLSLKGGQYGFLRTGSTK